MKKVIAMTLMLLAAACSYNTTNNFFETLDGGEADSDGGQDAASDSDTDADTDTDSDTDGDTDTETESDSGEGDGGVDGGEDAGLGCVEGDYVINTSLDVIPLYPYACITGDLITEVIGLSSLNLPNLEWIGGRLTIRHSALTTLDGLANLTYVSEWIQISNNTFLPQCEVCTFAAHVTVGPGYYETYYGNLPDTCSDTCS